MKEQPKSGSQTSSVDELTSLLAVIFSWIVFFPVILLVAIAAGPKFWDWTPIVQFFVLLILITCVLVFVLYLDNEKRTERILGALFSMPKTPSDVAGPDRFRPKLGDVFLQYFSSLGVVAIFLSLTAFSFSCYSFTLQGPVLAAAALAIFFIYVIALLRFGAALSGRSNRVVAPVIVIAVALTAFVFVFSVASGTSTSCS